MKYLILEDGIIVNIIIADSEFANDIGAKPFYDGAAIGDAYNPPPAPLTDSERIEVLESENALLKAQLQAQTERSDFIEDCIAEMATQVYAQ